jgi:hypothetical protein
MSFIDRLLDLFGLQRKSAIPETQIVATQPQEQQKEESAFDSRIRKHEEALDHMMEMMNNASLDLTTAIIEQRATLATKIAQAIRDGSTSGEEWDRLLKALATFGFDDTSPELSDEIKQALRDALEKRGKEDQDNEPKEGE